MLRLQYAFCIVFAVLIAAQASALDEFWYSVDGPVPLIIDSSKAAVLFESEIGEDDQALVLSGFERIEAVIEDSMAFDGFMVCSLTVAGGYAAFLDSLALTDEIRLAEPYYRDTSGRVMLMGQTICTKFADGVTEQEIDSINAMYSVIQSAEIMPGVYSLKNTGASGYRTLDLANLYHNLDQTHWALPNFLVEIELDGYALYDYYHEFQYHIKRVVGEFNIASAWDFAGLDRPVTVAVLDDGVDLHEDLPTDRLLVGFDFYNTDYEARPGSERYHGMACAGIIAASHTTDSMCSGQDSTGLLSLNPHARILPIKIFSDGGSGQIPHEKLAAAIEWTIDFRDAEVLSNSWSYLNPFPNRVPDVEEALQRVYEYGRGGLGCPVIFSAGDWGTAADCVKYPARLECCFAVGAIDTNDVRFPYSSFYSEEPQVALVAYSSQLGPAADFWALDQMGTLGTNMGFKNPFRPDYLWYCAYEGNDLDYNCHFAGTSAAAPVVAGVASLLISKDSMLTAEQVYDILRKSAVRELAWTGGVPIDTPHVEYGYGRVDAFRAVLSLSHGDIVNDGKFNLSDITFLIAWIYLDGPEPFPSPDLGDVTCDGRVNLSDVTALTNYVYMSGPPPVKPCFEYDAETP